MGTKNVTKYRFKDEVAGEAWIILYLLNNVLNTDAFDKWAIENHTKETVTKGASIPILGANTASAYSSNTKTITVYLAKTDIEKKLTNEGKDLTIDPEVEENPSISDYIIGTIRTLPNGKIIVMENKAVMEPK